MFLNTRDAVERASLATQGPSDLLMKKCACGSGLVPEECCIPKTYPICDSESGWRNLNVEIHGVDNFGHLVPVPRDLTTTLTVNQPHHVDPRVTETLEPWFEAFCRKVELSAPAAALKDLNSVSGLESNLSHGLTATRYHQRQFLCRMEVVNARHGQAIAKGNDQLQIVFNDLPLTCELEAFLIRATGSLDALAQLVGLILTGKQRKFWDLLKMLEKSRSIPATFQQELSALFREHSTWVDESKKYRNAIVHEADFKAFRGPKLGPHGISTACIADDDASVFVIRVWSSLLLMVRGVGDLMLKHSTDWRLPLA